jgi:hypothetical protein
MIMFRRFAQLGTYVALTAGLIFHSESNVRADACWDRYHAKLDAQNVITQRYIALKAGDCAYVDKALESARRWDVIANEAHIRCKHVWHNVWTTEQQRRAIFTSYCKSPAPEARPAESASQRPAQKQADLSDKTRADPTPNDQKSIAQKQTTALAKGRYQPQDTAAFGEWNTGNPSQNSSSSYHYSPHWDWSTTARNADPAGTTAPSAAAAAAQQEEMQLANQQWQARQLPYATSQFESGQAVLPALIPYINWIDDFVTADAQGQMFEQASAGSDKMGVPSL